MSGDRAMFRLQTPTFGCGPRSRILHWRTRIVEEAKIKMRKGRPCKCSKCNPLPGAAGYTRVPIMDRREDREADPG